MNALLIFLSLMIAVGYLLLGMVFTVDVLFHESLPNEAASYSISAIIVLVLLFATAGIIKLEPRRKFPLFATTAIGLLCVQLLLQNMARSVIADSLDAQWQDVRGGLIISDLSDEVLFTAAGRPIGVRLSLTLKTAQDASFVLFPHLKSSFETYWVSLSPAHYRRDPPFDGDSRQYEADTAYRLTYDMAPSDLGWDPEGQDFCARFQYVGAHSFLKMKNQIRENSVAPARFEIAIDGVLFETTTQFLNFAAVTAGTYDYASFADTGTAETFPLCDPAIAHITIR